MLNRFNKYWGISSSSTLQSRVTNTTGNIYINNDLKLPSLSYVVQRQRDSGPSKKSLPLDTNTNQVVTTGKEIVCNNKTLDKDVLMASNIGRTEESTIVTHLTPPIWTYPPEKVTIPEYLTLYNFLNAGKNTDEPLACKHFVIQEEDLHFSAIIYIPQRTSIRDTFSMRNDRFNFCVKDKFILGACKDLLPTYLSFFRGVVEIESEKILAICTQPMHPCGNKILECLQKNLLLKALELIQQIAEDTTDNELMDQFYGQYLENIKQGVVQEKNPTIVKKLCQVLRFQSSYGDAKRWWSFPDYVSRMKKYQNRIYYGLGESNDHVLNSIYAKRAAMCGFEVIIMTWPQDKDVVQKLNFNWNVLVPVDQEFESDENANDNKGSMDINSVTKRTNELGKDADNCGNETRNDSNGLSNQGRKQPVRQARQTCLEERPNQKDSEGEKSQSSPKGRNEIVSTSHTERHTKDLINFEGKMLTMKEFTALPIPQKYVVEEVDSPFFDITRNSLCVRVKWKYYPDKHRNKYNNEWADNLQNFNGGVKAADTYFNQDPNQVNEDDKGCFVKAKVHWNKLKKGFNEKNAYSSLMIPSHYNDAIEIPMKRIKLEPGIEEEVEIDKSMNHPSLSGDMRFVKDEIIDIKTGSVMTAFTDTEVPVDKQIQCDMGDSNIPDGPICVICKQKLADSQRKRVQGPVRQNKRHSRYMTALKNTLTEEEFKAFIAAKKKKARNKRKANLLASKELLIKTEPKCVSDCD